MIRASDAPAAIHRIQHTQAKIRGKNQSLRALNDGISMLRVSENAISKVADQLTEMRNLAVAAASDHRSAADKQDLVNTFETLKAEINNTASTTEFNGVKLIGNQAPSTGLSATQADVIDELRAGWLKQSENLVSKYYGITADGASMTMDIRSIDGAYNTAAYVSASFYSLAFNPAGTGINLSFVIDVDDYAVFGEEYDRIIAHEVVHAAMNRTVNMLAIADGTTTGSGTWFKEGTAEFIPGADDRVVGTLTRHTEQEIVDRAVELIGGATWGGGGTHSFSTADDYTASYVAIRYLHDRIKNAGGEGIKDIFNHLQTNVGSGVDGALQNISNGTYAGGLSDFGADFTTNGLSFLQSMDLSNDDIGAIGGFDADGGQVRNAADVVPDVYDYERQPMEGFELIWPLDNEISTISSQTVSVQSGADSSNRIEINLAAISTNNLGLDDIDLRDSTTNPLGRIDKAINLLAESQASVGATLNRLESALSAESSAIIDLEAGIAAVTHTDYVAETADLARALVQEQVHTSMLAEFENSRTEILRLLE